MSNSRTVPVLSRIGLGGKKANTGTQLSGTGTVAAWVWLWLNSFSERWVWGPNGVSSPVAGIAE